MRHWGPGLILLSPSLVVLAIFVYGLIGWTMKLSTSDQHTALKSNGFVGLKNYTDLFTNDINGRFVHSLKNLVIFTVVFMVGALLLGVVWALLMDRAGARGDRSAMGFRVDYPNDLWNLIASTMRVGDGR